jgi:hypothetical protein
VRCDVRDESRKEIIMRNSHLATRAVLGLAAAIGFLGCSGGAIDNPSASRSGSDLNAGKPPPPPPPPSSSCTAGSFGDPKTCLDPVAIKTKVADLCAADGLDVADLAGDGACAGGESHFVKFVCCPASPVVCTPDTLGDPKTCLDDGAIEKQAAEACSKLGAELTDLGLDEACGKGSSNFAKFTCCTPAPPPPPKK